MFCSPLLMISLRSICTIVCTQLSTAEVACHIKAEADTLYQQNTLRSTCNLWCIYDQATITRQHGGSTCNLWCIDVQATMTQGSIAERHLEILQNLLKLPIYDLASFNITMEHFQLLGRQPVRGPLGVIKTVPKLGLHSDNSFL